VKILGSGEIDRQIVVEAHKFSDSARQKIENAGGQAKVIGRA
jgi:large subunit ribosomal protein L15